MKNFDLKKPYLISLDITNKCNLKCLHCYNRSGNDLIRDELSDDEILQFLEEVGKLKIHTFCFCGGETFLRFDLIKKGIKLLKEYGVNQVNLVTNGILMTDEKAKRLKNAGITSIQISLDGSCEKTHNKMRQNEKAFCSAINAIKILNDNQMDTSIAFCPTEFNIHEFVEVAELLEKYEYVHNLRCQPLMILGRAMNNIEPSEEQYRKLVDSINEMNNSKKFHFNIHWGDPIDHIIRFSSQIIKNTAITVHSNGDIVLSPYLPIIIGNIKKYCLNEYLKNVLMNAWAINDFKEYFSSIRSKQDLGLPYKGKIVYQSDSNRFDLVDDKEVLMCS